MPGPAVMSSNFGVSSSHFPFRVQTDRKTDRPVDTHTVRHNCCPYRYLGYHQHGIG